MLLTQWHLVSRMRGITKHPTAVGCPHNKEVSSPTVKVLGSVDVSAASAAVTPTHACAQTHHHS